MTKIKHLINRLAARFIFFFLWKGGLKSVKIMITGTKKKQLLFYFYFFDTSPPSSFHSRKPGDPRVLPQVWHAVLSVSVTHLGFEWAVTGASLRRLTITVSPGRRSGATFAAAFTDAKHLKSPGSSGMTMVSLHLWEPWSVSPTFDLWGLGMKR